VKRKQLLPKRLPTGADLRDSSASSTPKHRLRSASPKQRTLKEFPVASTSKLATSTEVAETVCQRKPTRPKKFAGKRKQSELLWTEATPMPKPKQTPRISKRRLEMAPSVFAKEVARHSDLSSTEVVEIFAARYNWTPEEKRVRINVVRGMRAAERHLCSRILRSIPLNRTPANIDSCLETECRRAEAHDSDEFL